MGAERVDPLSPTAAREHPWAVPRQDPRGCPHLSPDSANGGHYRDLLSPIAQR